MIRKQYKEKLFQPDIYHAAFIGDERELLEALEMGQKPNELHPEEGTSAFHKAAANGHMRILEILLGKGCNINAIDTTGQTALHLAARNGHLEVIKWLVKQGADTSIKTVKGRTALDGIKVSGLCGYVRINEMTSFLKQCENGRVSWQD